MKIIGIVFGLLLLAGCQTSPSSQTQETVPPTDYQACIQAAKSGNGAESEAKCERVMDDTR